MKKILMAAFVALGMVFAAVAQEADLGAAGQKALDSCKADTTAAAADDYYFAFEFVFKHVEVLPFFSNKINVD